MRPPGRAGQRLWLLKANLGCKFKLPPSGGPLWHSSLAGRACVPSTCASAPRRPNAAGLPAIRRWGSPSPIHHFASSLARGVRAPGVPSVALAAARRDSARQPAAVRWSGAAVNLNAPRRHARLSLGAAADPDWLARLNRVGGWAEALYLAPASRGGNGPNSDSQLTRHVQ